MAIVAGVDFGTLSVRVTLFDSGRREQKGGLATASAAYPLKRKREDPDFATQSHQDQMDALVSAMRDGAGQGGDFRRAGGSHRARYHRLERGAGRRRACSRSMTTICGATIAPRARRRRLPSSPTASIWKRLSGAAGSTPTSGDSPSCCTGCATTRKSVASWRVLSNTATWLRRLSAGSPIPSW